MGNDDVTKVSSLPEKGPCVVVEGVEGYWHYHLGMPEKKWESLCGRRTMGTELPRDRWGYRGHLNEKYCEECLKLEQELVHRKKSA